MKIHTTNYANTFIEIAEDSPTAIAEVPPLKGEDKSVANLQFEMLVAHPYHYTSDDVLFAVHAIRKDLSPAELDAERQHFFSKGQACFRASPLTKRYGWGVHSNAEGKIAMFAADSTEYQQFLQDDATAKVKAMRSKRA
jgi:Family of unknown function (DUF6157)